MGNNAENGAKWTPEKDIALKTSLLKEREMRGNPELILALNREVSGMVSGTMNESEAKED